MNRFYQRALNESERYVVNPRRGTPGRNETQKNPEDLQQNPNKSLDQNINPQKIPCWIFGRALTISLEIKCLCLFILSYHLNLKIPLNTQKIPFLNQTTRFSHQKKSQNQKFHTHDRQSLWPLFLVKTLSTIFLANYLHLGLWKCPMPKTLLMHKGYFPYLQPGWHPRNLS